MVAKYRRRIRDGTGYNLFPPAKMKMEVVSQDTDVWETVDWIQKIIRDTLDQTKEIAQVLRRKTTYETLRACWEFVYHHVQYKEDEEEELHSPARIWVKRKIGVDCDDYTIMLSSILTNLGIEHSLRLAEYKHLGYYQHIYVVVRLNGRWVILDPVKDDFDVEHPYTNFKDIPMKLKVLSGFSGAEEEDIDLYYEEPDGKLYINPNFYNTPAEKAIAFNEMNTASNNLPANTANNPPTNTEKPKFFSAAWFKKNQTPLLVVGGTLTLGWLLYLSFAHEAEEEEKEAKKRAKKDKDDKDELSGVPKPKKLRNTLA